MQRISDIQTDLTRKIQGKDEQWICPQCGVSETQYFLKIIPTGKTDNFFPRWVPQIKEVCVGCGRYRRFVPQSELVITRFNERLQGIPVRAKKGDVV
jgi:hypothetical protein